MDKESIGKPPIKKSSIFKPDRSYIKNAMEEYKRRGGRIDKIKPSNGFYSDMTVDENLLTEPGTSKQATHIRNR